MPLTSRLRVAASLVFVLVPAGDAADAAQVGGLAARHRNGQTFLTWVSPPGTGWAYRVYASSAPLRAVSDLDAARVVGEVGDSTWCDRRLSALRGTIYAFATDSAAAPLAPEQGLFVATPVEDGARYYAVTARQGAAAEDRSIMPGENALDAPVTEVVAPPRPVYQRTLVVSGATAEIYTLWVTDRPTSRFPAMANRPSLPYGCAVVRGGPPPDHALLVRGHGRGASFLHSLGGTGQPGEWRLSIDDYLPNQDVATLYYGYHEDYDVASNANAPPVSGVVRGVTHARVLYTLDWALASFPVDPLRVYALGFSMGGTFAAFLALHEPERFAAVWAVVPKLDLSFLPDPFPAGRAAASRLWGDVTAVNLPTDEGLRVYERLDAGFLAGRSAAASVPPIFAFNGKHDDVVGWAEKIPYYRAARDHRTAAVSFWDGRGHSGPGAWNPMQNARYLHRFRLDRSFPALSGCSADHDPGDGDPADGDSVGTINGFVEWDTTLTDRAERWEVTLRLRDLTTLWGGLAAPESCAVDVTPRRLQRFATEPGAVYAYRVERVSDGAVVGEGVVAPDSLGLVTVRRATVHRSGSRVRIEPLGPAASPGRGPLRPGITLVPQPVLGPARLEVLWPDDGEAELALFDLAGRTVRVWHHGPARRGPARFVLDPDGLPSGVYFARARLGPVAASRRVVIAR